MTKPTQAQIEAAAISLCKSWPKTPDGCAMLCMDRLGSIPKEGCRHAIAVHGKRAEAALTAAAEAGEPKRNLTRTLHHHLDSADKEIERLKTELAATIERCAQVAETFGGHNVPLIAAALRAMKEPGS